MAGISHALSLSPPTICPHTPVGLQEQEHLVVFYEILQLAPNGFQPSLTTEHMFLDGFNLFLDNPICFEKLTFLNKEVSKILN